MATPVRRTITSRELAQMLIRSLGGDPNNEALIRAVEVWKASESSSIMGNNPWFMTGVGTCGTFHVPGNGLTFKRFCTLQDGVDATAALLKSGAWPGYKEAAIAVKAGDATGFLDNIQKSPWAGGHYGYALVKRFQSALSWSRTLVLYDTVNSGGGTSPGAGSDGPSQMLGAWNDAVKFPIGHIITADDVETMMRALDKQGAFSADVTGQARSKAQEILMATIGRAWTKDLQEELQKQFQDAASASDWGKALTTFLGNAGKIVGFALDTENWLYIFALIGGLAFTFYGFSNLMRSGPQEAAVERVSND